MFFHRLVIILSLVASVSLHAVGSHAAEPQIIHPCRADLDTSGLIGFSDLTLLLSGWGPGNVSNADINESGSVGFADLTFLLGAWGTECAGSVVLAAFTDGPLAGAQFHLSANENLQFVSQDGRLHGVQYLVEVSHAHYRFVDGSIYSGPDYLGWNDTWQNVNQWQFDTYYDDPAVEGNTLTVYPAVSICDDADAPAWCAMNQPFVQFNGPGGFVRNIEVAISGQSDVIWSQLGMAVVAIERIFMTDQSDCEPACYCQGMDCPPVLTGCTDCFVPDYAYPDVPDNELDTSGDPTGSTCSVEVSGPDNPDGEARPPRARFGCYETAMSDVAEYTYCVDEEDIWANDECVCNNRIRGVVAPLHYAMCKKAFEIPGRVKDLLTNPAALVCDIGGELLQDEIAIYGALESFTSETTGAVCGVIQDICSSRTPRPAGCDAALAICAATPSDPASVQTLQDILAALWSEIIGLLSDWAIEKLCCDLATGTKFVWQACINDHPIPPAGERGSLCCHRWEKGCEACCDGFGGRSRNICRDQCHDKIAWECGVAGF